MNEVTSLSAAAAVIIAAAVSLPLTSAAQAQQGSHAATAAHRIHNRVQFVDRKPDYFARAPFTQGGTTGGTVNPSSGVGDHHKHGYNGG